MGLWLYKSYQETSPLQIVLCLSMAEINCLVSDSTSLNQHCLLSRAELDFLLASHGLLPCHSWWSQGPQHKSKVHHGGEVVHQELEAAGHIASSQEQRLMNTCYFSVPCLHLHGPGSQLGDGATHIQGIAHFNAIKIIPHRHTNGSVSQVVFDSATLTMNTNHHRTQNFLNYTQLQLCNTLRQY